MLSPGDYWLIGYLEGEGWFGVRHMTPVRAIPSFSVTTTDADIANRVANYLGVKARGPYKRKPNEKCFGQKPRYIVAQSGKRALRLAMKIRPYMSNHRKIQIDKMIALGYPLPGHMGSTSL